MLVFYHGGASQALARGRELRAFPGVSRRLTLPALEMLTGFQNAFVGLCSDATLRGLFASNAAAALAPFALEPRERAALEAIPLAELERYAESLLAKRWGEVRKVVPLTRKVSPKLGARYRRWLADHPAHAKDTVLSPGAAEALRALAPLRRILEGDAAEAVYTPDLLSFEVLSHCARADGEPRVLRSRYRVHEIVATLREGMIPIDPDTSPTELRFDEHGVKWRQA